MAEQFGRQLCVVKAKCFALQDNEVCAICANLTEKFRIRLSQFFEQHQDADVVEETGDKCIVAAAMPVRLAQLACGHCSCEGICPVPSQLLASKFRYQLVGKTEAKHKQLQRLRAQHR